MGAAGRIARAFLDSKLTPLVVAASLGLGALGLAATPREEEPQISVPMIDVSAGLPGLPAAEVEHLLVQPIEQAMLEIPNVEHVYSMSGDGGAMVTVRFAVGEDMERSVTRVQAKLGTLAALPVGTVGPQVQPHGIDDVPILALTLHSRRYGADALRRLALEVAAQVRSVPEVAQVDIIGGAPREVRVELDPARLTATGVTPGEVVASLAGAGTRTQGGDATAGGAATAIYAGTGFTTADAVGAAPAAARDGRVVRVRDVATVIDGTADRESYVLHAGREGGAESAVTIAIAKRKGANATHVAEAVLAMVDRSRARLFADGVTMAITRNYGETASEKASELILHLAIATLSVTALVGLVLGWREAAVVLVAVPVTLALTLFAAYALGYTLNRITLFALIFSIGILVDDAIVVVENIYRHLQFGGADTEQAAIEGVDEVGNPTILATFTVIAAILPMAFVRGLMGPYMRPIPVGASVAMLASLGVAFIVTPWLSYRLLKGHVAGGPQPGHAPGGDRPSEAAAVPAQGAIVRVYRAIMHPLLSSARHRRRLYAGVLALLAGSVALLGVGLVQVKMLPFDDKSEFQVVLDLPEGTPLETTAALGDEVARALRAVPEVTATQVYAGTAAPFNFNGLVRHYFLRRAPNMADVQVTLQPKGERHRQSHAIALAVRPAIDRLARRYGASAKIAEIPAGPPVLSTLVAEVYGKDDATRLEAAQAVKHIFETTPGVVDVDWSIEAPQPALHLVVNRDRAAEAGTSVEVVARTVALAEHGAPAALAARPSALEPVPVVPRLPRVSRSTLGGLLAIPVATATGPQPLARFVAVDSTPRPSSRRRKDLRPVITITGDVAGSIESPVYAILAMNRRLDSVRVQGAAIRRYNAVQPEHPDETALKWDGEWQVTIEVFRDLGIAFAVVLVLIYVLVVGWFRSLTIPLVIMAPIPLTLVGILPGHALGGAFFTATSMIGMIALAGIIVRNSILLVDFIQLEEARGVPLDDAVLAAGAVRFRPIALTAAAVVAGGLVMVLDPIFQGLAVALISGAIVATMLTMVVVPLLYWQLRRHQLAAG